MTEAMQEKIVKMARYYISAKKVTMESVSEKFGVSYSTANKYLNTKLKDVNIELWHKVQLKKAWNINRSRQNFIKPHKRCILSRLFKK